MWINEYKAFLQKKIDYWTNEVKILKYKFNNHSEIDNEIPVTQENIRHAEGELYAFNKSLKRYNETNITLMDTRTIKEIINDNRYCSIVKKLFSSLLDYVIRNNPKAIDMIVIGFMMPDDNSIIVHTGCKYGTFFVNEVGIYKAQWNEVE